jgi:hypothetical protein
MSKNRGIQWVVDATNMHTPEGRRKVRVLKPSVSEKWGLHVFRVSICSQCNRVWDWLVAGDYCDVSYYKDFPKLKLPVADCFKCNDTHKPTKKPIRIQNDSNT